MFVGLAQWVVVVCQPTSPLSVGGWRNRSRPGVLILVFCGALPKGRSIQEGRLVLSQHGSRMNRVVLSPNVCR